MTGPLRRGLGRVVLLLFRAVPAPVWAFLFVLVLFPGLWPGAVALGIYNAGVLGRLFAGSDRGRSRRTPRKRSELAGGGGPSSDGSTGVLPRSAPRLLSLSLYRGEVIARETIVIGVVGCLVASANCSVTTSSPATSPPSRGWCSSLVALAVSADAVGATLRRTLR